MLRILLHAGGVCAVNVCVFGGGDVVAAVGVVAAVVCATK